MNSIFLVSSLFLGSICATSPILIGMAAVTILFSLETPKFSGDLYVKALTIKRATATKIVVFINAFLLAIVFMPLENVPKFIQTLLCLLIAGIFAPSLRKVAHTEFLRAVLITLCVILVGDVVQLSGILGSNMEVWKDIVGFPQLSDTERESSLGFLGVRYYGWFAEPSYHGTFTGLLTGLLAIRGRFKLALILAVVFYVLCPCPMLFFGFIYLISGLLKSQTLSPRARRIVFLGAAATMILAVVFMYPRAEALVLAFIEMRAGSIVNTSESIRLLYPFLGMIEVMSTSSWWLPISVDCVADGRCLPEISKFAVVTYWVFFGFAGLAGIFIALRMSFGIRYSSVFILSFFASVMSGGAGYLIQPFFIIMLISLGRHWCSESKRELVLRPSFIN